MGYKFAGVTIQLGHMHRETSMANHSIVHSALPATFASTLSADFDHLRVSLTITDFCVIIYGFRGRS